MQTFKTREEIKEEEKWNLKDIYEIQGQLGKRLSRNS